MRKIKKAKQRARQQKAEKKITKILQKSVVAAQSRSLAYQHTRAERLPSLAARAVEAYRSQVLDQVDGMAGLRNGIARMAEDRGEWAGIPMPLSDLPMTIEPSYPKAAALSAIGRAPEPEPGVDAKPDPHIRNVFFSARRRANVIVYDGEKGARCFVDMQPAQSQVALILNTLAAADAWGINQERNAVDTLGEMLRHRQFKQYLLTGSFMEQSPRSGLHYVFRRLRPTIVITTHRDNTPRVMCTLCLHPIGYYENSWAGVMTPTDEVVAHLTLMRHDEHLFWRRANQHHPIARQSGI